MHGHASAQGVVFLLKGADWLRYYYVANGDRRGLKPLSDWVSLWTRASRAFQRHVWIWKKFQLQDRCVQQRLWHVEISRSDSELKASKSEYVRRQSLLTLSDQIAEILNAVQDKERFPQQAPENIHRHNHRY